MKDMKKKAPAKADKDMKKKAGYMKGGMVKGMTKADAKGMKKKPGYK
jgi:hypothetical protein